jgi:D-3-phosphoglycerate dehydrogenase
MQRHLDEYRAILADHDVDVDAPALEQQMSERDLADIIGGYDGAIAGDDPFTAEVLGRARRLRIISKWGVGIDNIDLDAARSLGIRVTNTPGVFGGEVADVAIGYLIMLARGLHKIDAGVRDGRWPKVEGTSLEGKCLAIVGLGSIGRALATRALAFGMVVLGHDPSPDKREAARALGVTTLGFDALLIRADFLSLNCPLTSDNRHMVGEAQFRVMQPSAYLINTARGPLVDEAALVSALEHHRLAGAALDVYEEEPLPPTSRLRAFDQVILGAHNGSNTSEAVDRVCKLAVQNLLDGLRGAD